MADAKPEPDPIQTQRLLVYTIVGLLCLAGLVLSIALGDVCARYGGEAKLALVGRSCSDHVTWTDYIPQRDAWIVVGIILGVNIAFYELRFYLRVYGVGALGALYVGVAAVTGAGGLPAPLVIFYALFGIALIASAWGIHHERREGWSAALAMCAVMLTGHFFGTAKIAQETGAPMAFALLPSMAILLPMMIALLTSPPGAPRVKPFARRAVAAAPQSVF
jgi:hypothetical protein